MSSEAPDPSVPRVLVVVGTRPEVIKMAPVVDALRDRSEEVETRVALTGQHTSLVEQALSTFGLEPAWDLEIMREAQTLYDVAHGCLEGLRRVVAEWPPGMLLVQGDTATVLFGSLVGFFERIRVGHVEAGLRSDDKWAPYPEEIFRRVTDVVADLHFAPTPRALERLRREGHPAAGLHLTGNPVVDALRSLGRERRPYREPALARVVEGDGRLVLLTAHRRESFGPPLRKIFGAVRRLAEEHPDIHVVYPVHPNPRVREPARELLSGHPRIHLTDPVGYPDLVGALRDADLVLTDSGGIQEEAPAFDTPVQVLREVTERPEGVEAGVAELVGTDPDRIVEAARIRLREAKGSAPAVANPYGDGRAGERIADIVVSELTGAPRRTRDWPGPDPEGAHPIPGAGIPGEGRAG